MQKITVFTPCGIVKFAYTDNGVQIESSHELAEKYLKALVWSGITKQDGYSVSYPPSASDLTDWMDGKGGIAVFDDTLPDLPDDGDDA